MIKHVLEKLHQVFRGTTLCVLAYDDADHSLKFAPGTLDYYKPTNPAYRRVHRFPLNYKKGSIACDVARKTLKSGEIDIVNIGNVQEHPDYLPLIAETQSELCASLVSSEKKLLGILVLERKDKFGFSKDDEALVDVVAQQLSMGLERFQRREQDNFHRSVSTLTAWAADLAHEINNEAFKIQALAYLIKAKPSDLEAVQAYTESLLESVQKLAQTTPRRSQGQGAIQLDATLLKLTEAIARKQNIEVEFVPGAEQVSIRASQLQFQRILRHLMRNASRAMLNKKHKKIILRTTVNPSENMAEIFFQDFGPGVNEKVRPFVFQTNITTKDQKDQGGYGLLITRLLVEEMGGSIRLLPKEPGKGAVFSIKIPVVEQNSIGEE
jgi:signal transduction histidine kinase